LQEKKVGEGNGVEEIE